MFEFLWGTSFCLFVVGCFWSALILINNFVCLLCRDFESFISFYLIFGLTLLFGILHTYINYSFVKNHNKGLKLTAKQIISFIKLSPKNWYYYVKPATETTITTNLLWITYKNKNIIPKTFFDYIILVFYCYYCHFKEQKEERKKLKEKRKQFKQENFLEAMEIAKLLEEDINKQLEKTNKELDKALKDNQLILDKLKKDKN